MKPCRPRRAAALPDAARARRPRAADERGPGADTGSTSRAARSPWRCRPSVAAGRRRRSSWSTPRGFRWPGSRAGDGWSVTPLTHAQYGPFRRLYLTPAEVRERYAGRTFVPVTDALTDDQLAELAGSARSCCWPWSATAPRSSPVGLLRATLAAAAQLPDAAVVAVPLAAHGDAEADHALGVQVVAQLRRRRPGRTASPTDGGSCPPEIAARSSTPTSPPRRAGPGALLHRALRQRQVDPRPRADGPAARAGRAHGDQPRRRRRTPEPVGRAHLLQGGPRDQHPPDRLGRRRDLPARRRRGRAARSRRSTRPASRCGRWSTRPAARSSSSTSRPRWRSASAATARASTPRRGAARSPSSPASPRPTRSRRTPTSGSTPPAARSRTPSTTCSSRCATPATSTWSTDAAGGRGATERRRRGRSAPREPEPSEARDPLSVLFVCTANICRSPYMELSAGALAGRTRHVELASAGTHGFRDARSTTTMAGALTDAGLDTAAFRSRRADRRAGRGRRPGADRRGRHRILLEDHPARSARSSRSASSPRRSPSRRGPRPARSCSRRVGRPPRAPPTPRST